MTQVASAALDEAAIRRLLEELGREAARQRFEVAPNPCVGAAVLAGERVIGRGFHAVWGEAHAEVRAFEAARASGVPSSEWDTLVVTLEPCSSRGKTPPCSELVRASGVRRVIVGALDPDVRHQGAGLRILQAAGLEVLVCDDVAPLASVAPHFLRWTDPDRMRRPRPWTIAKWAQTRTGQMLPPEQIGGGRWISGPESQREVQVLRGRVDAIVSGVGTVLADDPRFSVRPPGNPARPPARVLFDSYLRTPPGSALFAKPGAGEGAGPVHILCLAGLDGARERALLEAGAHVHALHVSSEREISLREAQVWMWEQGFRRVLLEAGPTLLSSCLAAGLVDQVRIYTGAVNGGRGPSMGESLQRLKLEQRLDRENGEDSVLEAFLVEA
ncbi:MAG: bifunctional diaminohydroxyphosphoribosylaminopyrimidine deaminase/5-amino-6-(5-phosphoribosylamino)uracil reductase RibD [Planctomycetes bacterium]|nr:bifunctional diaminohydroxyphosphoribosylaminopyrimidine deaminase/5-amino-6-(5-phosphoribosylamino)uracil reductase RibD [Planctomycetota bacterium]